MGAKRGIGTTISRNGTPIGVLINIAAPEKSAADVDSTTLDVADGYKTYIQGIKEGGDCVIKGYFDTADAGQMTLDAAFEAGSLDTYIITFPAAIGATYTFTALITKLKIGEADIEKPLDFEATFKISSKPVLGVTASGGLTALALTGAGGTISPAFGAAITSYTFGGVTAASVTITPTAAAHTIKLYVDGVYTQDIVSGAASGAITMAIGTKKLTLVCYEAAKTPKVYDIVVVKTA